MRFPLIYRLWVIGLAFAGLCLADSNPLLTPADEFFRSLPQHRNTPVTVAQSPQNIWQDQREIWTSPFHLKKRDLVWLVPLAATAGVLIASDHHNETLIHSNPSNRSLSSNISNLGVGAFGAVAGSYFVMGKITRNEHARETGILTAEALTDSVLVSEALKFATQRARPDTGSAAGGFWQGTSLNSSFPSEHAAMAWSAAAVIAREYPGPVTTWGAYGLASLVSFSRITANQHFPSDVLIGAAVGYLIGRHVYNAHHDDRLTDLTGSAPLPSSEITFARPESSVHRERERTVGSPYVPLDSWIYPALRRLAALGYIPDQVSDLAPWTRLECVRQVAEAETIASTREARDRNRALNHEALRLIKDLKAEFSERPGGENAVRLESIYTRITDIQGNPLRDSYHFGQTLFNDYGRPYSEGFNNVTGFSSYATSGRFSAYAHGEYQEAPGTQPYSLGVRQFISGIDGTSLQSPATAATNRFQPLEMYAGVQLGFENITFGRQSLWWGPGEESAFSFSNNAAPFDMLRLAQTRPLVLPGPLSLLGKIRTEFIFGKLSGHQWPARPYINAQKISLDLTDNFEVGFTRAAIFGGVGHPLTLGSLKESLFSFSSVDYGPYGSPDLPGDRFSNFDFRWRLPGLRRYVTIYSDSYADDDPNPLDNPKRSAWGPGLYLTRLPGLSRLDFRFETYATWLYRKDQGGDFLYWDNQYRDSNTNSGNLLGSWVGRDSRAYTASTTYWLSDRSKIMGSYRQIKAGTKFLPGGGTQTDAGLAAQWSPSPEWLFAAQVQYERYYVPVLGVPQHDLVTSLQLTFYPRLYSKSSPGE